ncbi:MAG TPA: hypothetical protein VK858_07025 [Longimicrobiales bacterium]|nr:hypothetical protein [Longimicrobiales bacterium]
MAAAFEDPNVDIMFPGWSPDGTEMSLWIQNWVMIGDIESTAHPWDVLARGGYPSWWPGA